MSVINTNVSSLQAQNSLHTNQSKLTTAMERLSSGVRINSAKDDAAGLAITTRMTSEIRGLTAAVRNANDGISVAQTAEGSLGEITNILQRLRELAVQSANSSNNSTDRSFLNTEASQLIDEAQRIGTQTNFNGVKLLDGSFTSQNFQVGANTGEVVVFNSIADSKATALGKNVLEAAGTKLGKTLTTGVLATSVADAAAAVNGVTAETNLYITTANGGKSSVIAYGLAADNTGANAGAEKIAAVINSKAANIGITATATNSTTLSDLSTAGVVSFKLNGANVSAEITTTNDLTALAIAINGTTATTKVTASFANANDKSQITLTSSDGSNIQVVDYTNSTAGNDTFKMGGIALTEGGNDSNVKTGTVTLSSTKGAITLTGANADVFDASASTFSSVYTVDLSTQESATKALSVLDAALTSVNNTRAGLGGLINRFEATISNQNTTIMNLSASRSRILDTDYAVETTNLAKAQIIQQAATAMLAQANQSSQSVLALLK